MPATIHIQYAVKNKKNIPSSFLLRKWTRLALQKRKAYEITIRIVEPKEIAALNKQYRKKNKPTNILSFPFHLPPGIELANPILGDLVICADVVNKEAKAQKKSTQAHWAHMIVHGVLHLLGYDHEKNGDAIKMERLEIKILTELGFDDPYGDTLINHDI